MSINVNELSFDGVSLHEWAPGFDSGIKGKWAEHALIGRKGALQEDQGDGVLGTNVTLVFADNRGSGSSTDSDSKRKAIYGKTAREQYDAVMAAITKRRRGVLVHPLRGSRQSILDEIKESMEWTQKGNTITVQLKFLDAELDFVEQFRGGSAALAQQAMAQVQQAQVGTQEQQQRIFGRSTLNLPARQAALTAVSMVNTYAEQVNTYATLALQASNAGLAQLAGILEQPATPGATGVAQAAALAAGTAPLSIRAALQQLGEVRQRGRQLPAAMQLATEAVRLSGSVPETQGTVTALELSLASCTALGLALQESQPVPIVGPPVTAPVSVYQFVQERYRGSGKTPAQLRALVQLVLALNPQLRTPARIPLGTELVRPAL